MTNILDEYSFKNPHHQNILDIFDGEWSSAMPEESGLITKPGKARLFYDDRVKWAAEVFDGFENLNVLELGPLEAGHSYMLQKMGAKRITSIEANRRAFLKCLCIKEIFKLNAIEFKLGDFIEFIKANQQQYDLVFASGVLYHMTDPLNLLELISNITNNLFIWTHYYDANIINENVNLKKKFNTVQKTNKNGIVYEWIEQSYNDALNWSGFCGGGQHTSRWLTRETIIKRLNHLGFNNLTIGFDHQNHPNGPAFALCARR